MAFDLLKSFLPNHPVPTRIWRGPFRGARILMSPRHSLRKIFGLYEHELNRWLASALRGVDRVIDVGANDGYFTFGCMAALRRQDRPGAIIAFEPQQRLVRELRESLRKQPGDRVDVQIVELFVGREVKSGMATLDALDGAFSTAQPRTNTLIKIDVEGGEMDVIAGAHSWIHPSNAFVIEVHDRTFLNRLKGVFAERRIQLSQLNQRSLPLLGRENRDEENWWLVSELFTQHERK